MHVQQHVSCHCLDVLDAMAVVGIHESPSHARCFARAVGNDTSKAPRRDTFDIASFGLENTGITKVGQVVLRACFEASHVFDHAGAWHLGVEHTENQF